VNKTILEKELNKIIYSVRLYDLSKTCHFCLLLSAMLIEPHVDRNNHIVVAFRPSENSFYVNLSADEGHNLSPRATFTINDYTRTSNSTAEDAPHRHQI
jgi:hypothetical protein